jgi:hypothetical protein
MSSKHAVMLFRREEGIWLGSATERLEAAQRIYNQTNLRVDATMPAQHSHQVLQSHEDTEKLHLCQ